MTENERARETVAEREQIEHDLKSGMFPVFARAKELAGDHG